MFRINAFGQRISCQPRLRFVDPPADDGNGGGSDPNPSDDPDKGFPDNTPVAEMTIEQRAAYHLFQSRKHERAERELQRRQADYDDLKAKADELAQLKEANATEHEREVETARREGENVGAQRYLKDAVKGRFQGITRKTDEEVETIFEHVDALSFTDDKGDIDTEKLKKYAATFGTSDAGGGKEDPVAEALKRQRQAGGGTGSSIAEKRKETRESMTKTKG